MPRWDGTGPMGYGPLTGRGFGYCGPAGRVGGRPRFGYGFGYGGRRGYGRGFGMGYGRGFGRGFGPGYDMIYEGYPEAPQTARSEKELLKEHREYLRNELRAVEKELEEL